MKDKVYQWLAWRFPRRLVLWCAVRLGAAATTGAQPATVVPELGFMEALNRWEK